MPSEPPYTALIATPGGLARGEFVAAAPPASANTRSSTPIPRAATRARQYACVTGGSRVDGVGAGRVEVRVPTSAGAGVGVGKWRKGQEDDERYTYYTVLDAHAPAGRMLRTRRRCVRRRERERWARGRPLDGDDDLVGGEMWLDDEDESPSSEAGSQASCTSPPGSSSHAGVHCDSSPWPEWDAPAWAAHHFDDEGWAGICHGVQDVIFTGEAHLLFFSVPIRVQLWCDKARSMCVECPSSVCHGTLVVLSVFDEISHLEAGDALGFTLGYLFTCASLAFGTPGVR
ncbi:hypothetical protein DFH06DRAFT_1317254 [Mycena polygramma]|nr:hypothetical protein DFH06DRAFT_1317254 [Mycena polygramma]